MFGLPLMRESHFFVDGVMAILARDSFIDIDRKRLRDPLLMIGEAAEDVEFSYGSELRNSCGPGDRGVSGADDFTADAAVET